jgi:hypothetical protein
MARYIKMTDVTRQLRDGYGKKPSPEMAAALSDAVRDLVREWGLFSMTLKKVEVWQPDEDALRRKFGGRRAMLRCWRCSDRKQEIARAGQVCDECKKNQGEGASGA